MNEISTQITNYVRRRCFGFLVTLQDPTLPAISDVAMTFHLRESLLFHSRLISITMFSISVLISVYKLIYFNSLINISNLTYDFIFSRHSYLYLYFIQIITVFKHSLSAFIALRSGMVRLISFMNAHISSK